MGAVTPLRPPRVERIGPGRYRATSASFPGRVYNVQLADGRGVCDCIGAEGAARRGNECTHIKQAKEKEYAVNDNNSTALAVRDPLAAQVVEYNPTLPTLDEMKVMVTIANSVYKTSGKLIPSDIRTSEEAFAVMLAGRELGLGPMESFREVYVVNGRTQPSARVLMGMVLRGDPTASFKWLARTPTRACVQLHRNGRDTIEVEYTMEDAIRAQLPKKNRDGSDGVWQKFPTDMLAYKAVTRACRLGGPDLITAVGAGVRGAPAVMRAIDEAIDADADELPELETSEPEPPPEPEVSGYVRAQNWLRDARETWDAPSHRAMLAQLNEAFPGCLNRAGDLFMKPEVRDQGEAIWAWINDTHIKPPADGEQGELIS